MKLEVSLRSYMEAYPLYTILISSYEEPRDYVMTQLQKYFHIQLHSELQVFEAIKPSFHQQSSHGNKTIKWIVNLFRMRWNSISSFVSKDIGPIGLWRTLQSSDPTLEQNKVEAAYTWSVLNANQQNFWPNIQ